MGDAVKAYEEKRRPLPNPACSWCGHPPHGQQCPQAILTDPTIGGPLPRTIAVKASDRLTVPCPCRVHRGAS